MNSVIPAFAWLDYYLLGSWAGSRSWISKGSLEEELLL